MGFFSRDTLDDAYKQLEKVNQEMRTISSIMHQTTNSINRSNGREILSHLRTITGYLEKYEKIKRSYPMLEQLEFERRSISLWNGNIVDITSWEFHWKNVQQLFIQELSANGFI